MGKVKLILYSLFDSMGKKKNKKQNLDSSPIFILWAKKRKKLILYLRGKNSIKTTKKRTKSIMFTL